VPAAGRAAVTQNGAATPGSSATAGDIGRRIQNDSTLTGQDLKVSVVDGVATLTARSRRASSDHGVLMNVKGIMGRQSDRGQQLGVAVRARRAVEKPRTRRREAPKRPTNQRGVKKEREIQGKAWPWPTRPARVSAGTACRRPGPGERQDACSAMPAEGERYQR
jgi:hypothetical protein